MLSNPVDLEPLETEKEKNRLEHALMRLQKLGMVELLWLESGKWRDLHRILRMSAWHIFHFVGHGSYDKRGEQGQLAFVGEGGRAEYLDAIQLARLLANHRFLRLAILNACEGAQASVSDLFSSTASLLVRRGLPAVLAMQYAITDRAATEFAQAFYEAMADGFPVDAALAEARVAISLALTNSLEWGVPVLYMRSPDGILFEMEEKHVQVQEVRLPEKRIDQKPLKGGEVSLTQGRSGRKAKRLVLKIAPGINIELLRIPTGEFLMGSSGLSKDAYRNEKPQHRVNMGEYYIGKYLVSNEQYFSFIKSTKSKPPRYWKGGIIPRKTERHPVVGVTWHDAVAFCNWVSVITGREFRLPTEAEWEKAARGEDGRLYPWGNLWDSQRLNCIENETIGTTTPVGQFSPPGDSPYGCVDMAGNVWEWCADWYGENEYQKRINLKTPVENPSGQARGKYKVTRGGSWRDERKLARCACRVRLEPGISYDNLGFRVALSAG
jgi:formylglycine-generating enzyme required for sulfatase activity